MFCVISYIFFMFTLLYTASTMSGKMKRVKVADANEKPINRNLSAKSG